MYSSGSQHGLVPMHAENFQPVRAGKHVCSVLSKFSVRFLCCCTGGYASIVAQYMRFVAVRKQQAAEEIQALTKRQLLK